MVKIIIDLKNNVSLSDCELLNNDIKEKYLTFGNYEGDKYTIGTIAYYAKNEGADISTILNGLVHVTP